MLKCKEVYLSCIFIGEAPSLQVLHLKFKENEKETYIKNEEGLKKMNLNGIKNEEEKKKSFKQREEKS